jgi:hypothetical protein
MMPREVRAALRRLQVQPLPSDLDLGQPGVLAELRHNFTNYDRLHHEFRFDPAEHRMFRWAVNQRILEAIRETQCLT